jgi:hypothetical protein
MALISCSLDSMFLIGEIQIDRALGEAGALGDVVETRDRESAFAEDFERRLEDLPRALSGEAAPTRFLRVNRTRSFHVGVCPTSLSSCR